MTIEKTLPEVTGKMAGPRILVGEVRHAVKEMKSDKADEETECRQRLLTQQTSLELRN